MRSPEAKASQAGSTGAATTHIVSQGECLSSIAYEAGFPWQTLWDHPRNAALREVRKDPNILLPGDQIFIPERHPRSEPCQTGRSHRFVGKTRTQRLQLALLAEDGTPRSGIRYTISIDGVEVAGRTDASGLVACNIRPNARQGTLTVHDRRGDETYELLLGHLDPLSTTSGVQARLNHLGFSCGAVDGVIGPVTRTALRHFQRAHGLLITGEIDDPTRSALENAHGH